MFKAGNIPHNKGISKFKNEQELVLVRRQYGKVWREGHITADREHHRRYRRANAEKHNQAYYEEALSHPWVKVCSICRRSLPISLYGKSRVMADGFNNLCKECHNKLSRQKYSTMRHNVIYHYSNGSMDCECCGEGHYEFLCIDHINGGGNKHRVEIGLGTQSFYSWLVRNNYPDGYRVLCTNCNSSLGFYGYCPHQGGG